MAEIPASVESEETGGTTYLTFIVEQVCYALDIQHVTEIIGLQPITPIPNLPPYIKGVINLRGKVIPVMDVRARFSIPQFMYHDRTCIVVVDVDSATIGLVVDAVSEVVDIKATEIEPTPSLAESVEARCISGLGKHGDQVKLIVNLESLVNRQNTFDATALAALVKDPAAA
jgi:purine-binding chemotaxis protein CheW